MICPRCLLEFFTDPKQRSQTKAETVVYAHLCKSGYIRPYPHKYCSDCKGVGDDNTELMSLDQIRKTNQHKKRTFFRDFQRNQEPETDLVLKAPEQEAELVLG